MGLFYFDWRGAAALGKTAGGGLGAVMREFT
jgi:hypothetical protein